MKKSDFYFDLPEELIAQTPLERRDASRLLTLDKTTGAVAHHHFYDLPQFLRPNDCLVLNDSRVLPARLLVPGVCGSALMSLAGLFGDFAIIKIIASSQFETAQAYLYRNRSTDAQSLSASVVILLLITLLINYSVHRSQNRKKERREA